MQIYCTYLIKWSWENLMINVEFILKTFHCTQNVILFLVSEVVQKIIIIHQLDWNVVWGSCFFYQTYKYLNLKTLTLITGFVIQGQIKRCQLLSFTLVVGQHLVLTLTFCRYFWLVFITLLIEKVFWFSVAVVTSVGLIGLITSNAKYVIILLYSSN